MKVLLSIVVLFFSFLLASCATRAPYCFNRDLTQERWQYEIDRDVNKWARGADKWFLTGSPNATEKANENAPYSMAMSTVTVQVPRFTNIKVKGDFQVQIYGSDEQNAVYIYGPNANVRHVAVNVYDDTLCVETTPHALPNMQRVIVRIGVMNLRHLKQMGRGTVEAVQIRSDGLCIISSGSGNIYLAGNVKLKRILQTGCGSVSVFGAYSPLLDIHAYGSGSVNVSGNIGLRTIMHKGRGDINIIGAHSAGLNIYAEGLGKIGINGYVRLEEIHAKENASVYISQTNSDTVAIYANDNARIGAAGFTNNLYVYTSGNGIFYGKNLLAQDAFVRADGASHINVRASNKIFASANQNGSVYFFGPSKRLSKFENGRGIVIPGL